MQVEAGQEEAAVSRKALQAPARVPGNAEVLSLMVELLQVVFILTLPLDLPSGTVFKNE